MHTPCLRREGWKMHVTGAEGDSLGQKLQCQEDSASLHAWLPAEGRSSQWAKPLPTPHTGEKATPASCHTTACTRFPHLRAGSHLQLTVCCSTYAFNSHHLLLNTFLVSTPGFCCCHLPKPFGCSSPEHWILTSEACHSLRVFFSLYFPPWGLTMQTG